MIFKIKGGSCLIDKDDLSKVNHLKWYISKTADGHRYAKNILKRKSVYLHRLVTGAEKGQLVDHINGNTIDNRKNN